MNFKLEEYHRGVSDDELIADLKRVASDVEKNSVTRNEQDEKGKFHSTTYVRRFKTWYGALEKAGLKLTRSSMNLSEEDLFENIETIWQKLGRQPRYAEIQKPFSKYCVGTYEHRFGTWRKALEAFVAFINNEECSSSEKAIKEPVTRHKTKRGVNWRLRFIVMRRDSFKCKNCGRSPATDPIIVLQIDHIKAWTNGGETVLENLQTLCSKCNIGKSNLE